MLLAGFVLNLLPRTTRTVAAPYMDRGQRRLLEPKPDHRHFSGLYELRNSFS